MMSNKACLHDSWIISSELIENKDSENADIRKLNMRVKLLGAFHDRIHNIKYVDIQSYKTELNNDISIKNLNGHGDWLVDVIGLNEDGTVFHEIEFSNSGYWLINCREIVYESQLLE